MGKALDEAVIKERHAYLEGDRHGCAIDLREDPVGKPGVKVRVLGAVQRAVNAWTRVVCLESVKRVVILQRMTQVGREERNRLLHETFDETMNAMRDEVVDAERDRDIALTERDRVVEQKRALGGELERMHSASA